MPQTSFGQRVRVRRRAWNLTQQELEHIAALDDGTIARIEADEPGAASAETVRDLAKALQVSADYLLCLVDEP